MNECKKCGTPMEDEELFCPTCGTEKPPSADAGAVECGMSDVGRSAPSTNNQQPCRNGVSVLWNTARKFVEETTLSFGLRLSSEEELKYVEIVVCSDVDSLPRLYKKVGGLAAGKEKQIAIPLKAPSGSAGEIPFDIFLRFEQAGAEKIVCASQSHHIYREEQAPQAVHYHSETNVSAGDGHANDQHVNVVGGDMPDLSKKEKKALWEEINAQENWEPLDLQETDQFPEEDSLQKSTSRYAEASQALRRAETGPNREKSRKKRERKALWVITGSTALALLFVFLAHEAEKPEPEPPVGSGDMVSKAEPVEAPLALPAPLTVAEGEFDVRFELLGGRAELVAGEKIRYRVFSNQDCYIALLCHQSDGSTVVLFPNAWHPNSFIPGGREIFVPDTGSGFEIVVSPPFGRDTVELIACTSRNDFHAMLAVRAEETTQNVPFVVERTVGLMRGLSIAPKVGTSPEWHRETLMVTTKAK